MLLDGVLGELQALLPVRLDGLGQDEAGNLRLKLRHASGDDLLLSIQAEHYRLHLAPSVPVPRPQRGPLAQLSLLLAGATLREAWQWPGDRIALLACTVPNRFGEPQPRLLVHELFGPRANVLLLDHERRILWFWQPRGRILGDLYPPLPPHDAPRRASLAGGPLWRQLPEEARAVLRRYLEGEIAPQPTRYGAGFPVAAYVLPLFPGGSPAPSLSAALAAAYSEIEEKMLREALRRSLLQRLKAARERLGRRLAAQEAELAATEDLEALRTAGEWVLAYATTLPPGASELALADDGTGSRRVIPLDPELTPAANANRFFTRYQKAKRRREELLPALTAGRAAATSLADLTLAVELAETRAELALLAEEVDLLTVGAGEANRRGAESLPPFSFHTSGGVEVLVGRNMRQNEWLTFRVARPEDHWLHAKDYPGSHVILRSPRPGPSDLYEAALLAAHFSRARGGSNVPVDVTLRRYVKKPKGTPPGYVVYSRQETHFVTPAGPRLEALLAQLRGAADGHEPT